MVRTGCLSVEGTRERSMIYRIETLWIYRMAGWSSYIREGRVPIVGPWWRVGGPSEMTDYFCNKFVETVDPWGGTYCKNVNGHSGACSPVYDESATFTMSPPIKKWICPLCGHYNAHRKNKCERCHR
jgi:hypothetical protein